MQSNQSRATVNLNIREQSKEKYEAKKQKIRDCAAALQAANPRASVECRITDTYGNIADAVTEDNRKAIDYIYEAMRRLDIEPKTIAMRGGTAGSFISTKGILTPNYFTGGMNFHSRYEFLPVPSLQKSYEMTMTLIHLIYEGK